MTCLHKYGPQSEARTTARVGLAENHPACGRCIVVVPHPSKVEVPVRFRSPARDEGPLHEGAFTVSGSDSRCPGSAGDIPPDRGDLDGCLGMLGQMGGKFLSAISTEAQTSTGKDESLLL